MSAALTQLKIAYEQEHMTLEEIAEDLSMDIIAVKAGLMQTSNKYRKDIGCETEADKNLDFTDEQMEVINEHLFYLATNAESEKVQASVSQYIRDDKKGRKDIKKLFAENTFNIVNFNDAIKAAREKTCIAV